MILSLEDGKSSEIVLVLVLVLVRLYSLGLAIGCSVRSSAPSFGRRRA